MNEINPTEAQIERFWAKVNRAGPDECWEWVTGYKDKDGYGRPKISGKKYRANRVAWTLANGPIPEGMQINHTCDNSACCNPTHLYTGTQKENMRDRSARGRTPEQYGSDNPYSKLKEEDIPQILNLSGSGTTQKEIAQRFGVSRRLIGMIIRGERWNHLTKIKCQT